MGKLKLVTLITLGIIVLLGTLSCSPSGVPQEEYDILKAKLNETESQVNALRLQLEEMENNTPVPGADEKLTAQFNELKAKHDANLNELNALKDQYDDLNSQFTTLESQHDNTLTELANLQQQYNELQGLYKEAVKEPAPIDMDELEQTLFALVNQTRADNGLEELSWGIYLYDSAKVNSREMAEKGEEQYSTNAAWQEVFRAAGYSTADGAARAAITVWSSNTGRFETNLLPSGAKFGAIGAYQEGGIIYISYLASIFQ